MGNEIDRLKSKFMGSLVGTAVGDSLGAGGRRYTDDTAMMIGVAESLVGHRGFDADHMAQVFVKNYYSEPWRGYGSGPPRIFEMIKSGLNWREVGEKMYPGGSYGNGSAMRIAPVGLFYYDDPDKLREIAYESSQITHTHVLGIEGAALQACAVALAVTTEPGQLEEDDFLKRLGYFVEADLYREKVESMKMLLRRTAGKPEVIRELGNTVEAFNSVPISIYSFVTNCGFRDCVEYALSLDGDRDTISAMTGAIAGACYGIEEIPAEWRSELENKDYIEKLGEGLWRMKLEGKTAK